MVLNEKTNAPRALEGKGNENEKPSCVDNRGLWAMGGVQEEQRLGSPWNTGSSHGLLETWGHSNCQQRQVDIGEYVRTGKRREPFDIWTYNARQGLAAIKPNPRGLYIAGSSIKSLKGCPGGQSHAWKLLLGNRQSVVKTQKEMKLSWEEQLRGHVILRSVTEHPRWLHKKCFSSYVDSTGKYFRCGK